MYETYTPKPYLSDLDLIEIWNEPGQPWRYMYGNDRLHEFKAYLLGMARDTENVASVRVCGSCGYPCLGTTETEDHAGVCNACLDEYMWCEDCGTYVGDYHEHEDEDDGCGCDSQAQGFTVRNDGQEPLANDTRTTVSLPAGVISDEGIKAIRRYLIKKDHHALACDLEPLGNTWQAKNGNYTKRLSRYAYQTYGIKLSPDVMSEIGNIASAHSMETSVTIEVTRRLNMSASDFYHDDSCWWGSYAESRCALKTNGGFGLRSFGEYGQVTGRAWVLPLRQTASGRFAPTFDTREPDALVVFNGYGDLSGYAPARILAHMYGWTYRKIGFECEPMYINAGGYLIAAESTADAYTDKSIDMSVRQHSDLYTEEAALNEAAAA